MLNEAKVLVDSKGNTTDVVLRERGASDRIIEEFMLDIMYEIPKDPHIGTVTVTEEYINGTGGPKIGMRGQDLIE